MKIAILGKRQVWYTVALQAAFKTRGIEVPCFPATGLVGVIGSKVRLSVGNVALEDFQPVNTNPDLSMVQ